MDTQHSFLPLVFQLKIVILLLCCSGVHRLMTNQLKNVHSFVESAVIAFDQYADLYVIELKVENSTQQVKATEVDMKKFIGV